jgi:peptide methionine sulfoxide reductase msrA/msrB
MAISVFASLLVGAIIMSTQACGPKDRGTVGNATGRARAETPSIPIPAEWRKLTPEEERVIVRKGTEAPFTGKYDNFSERGTYICRRCGAPLYRSSDKFDSHCGWPSFDDEIPGAVRRVPDPDGSRTEIECANCGAHLGHVFLGEELTAKDTRHCVNSLSLQFVPEKPANAAAPAPAAASAAPGVDPPAADPEKNAPPTVAAPTTETAIFAGGCFWGVEYRLKRAPGVVSIRVGYTGGHTERPTYAQVCTGTTGHAEAVEVLFDLTKTTYEAVARRFFEIHDPTQVDRQGPDVGLQYRSVVFYKNDEQRQTAEKLIGLLKAKGLHVATKVEPAATFWPAEAYHQDYYDLRHEEPYCHIYTKRF